MMICLGPVCIPLWGLLPFLLAVFAWVKSKWNSWLYGKETVGVKSAESIEKSGNCKDESETSGHSCCNKNTLVTDGKVVHVKDSEHWAKLLDDSKQNNYSLIADFTATWCGPCKAIAPKFADAASQNTKALFVKVDIDELQAVATQCQVFSVPNFQLFKNGIYYDGFTGADPQKLKTLINKA